MLRIARSTVNGRLISNTFCYVSKVVLIQRNLPLLPPFLVGIGSEASMQKECNEKLKIHREARARNQ